MKSHDHGRLAPDHNGPLECERSNFAQVAPTMNGSDIVSDHWESPLAIILLSGDGEDMWEHMWAGITCNDGCIGECNPNKELEIGMTES